MSHQSKSESTHHPILVVDDDENYRTILLHTIEELGFTCIAAKDGVDALNIVVAHKSGKHLHAIITDLSMPRMDGLDLARILLALHFPGILVVISGSLEASGYRLQDIHRVTPHFFEKPASRAQLKTLLRPILLQ
jgi:chemosensory pili system protein ChpA (sensor histidine kinase/response regulator)